MRKQILSIAIALPILIASATSSYAVENTTKQQCNQVGCVVEAPISINSKQHKPSIETLATRLTQPGGVPDTIKVPQRLIPPKPGSSPAPEVAVKRPPQPPKKQRPSNQVDQNKPTIVGAKPIDIIHEVRRRRPRGPGN